MYIYAKDIKIMLILLVIKVLFITPKYIFL